MMKVRNVLTGLIVSAVLVGVVSCGSGSGDYGQPPAGGGGQTPLEPTLDSIQANVFSVYCVGCHAGAGAPQGLQLESASLSYANLVNVPVPRDTSQVRVKPFEPDNSFLIRKLEYPQGTIGARMPLNQPPLDPSMIAVIRQWITNGALEH